MAIAVENKIGDSSSNPGWGCLCSFWVNAPGESVNPYFLNPTMG